MELQNLNDIAMRCANDYKKYTGEDIELPEEFKDYYCKKMAFKDIKFNTYTTIITTSQGLRIYLPNQWFLLARYCAEFVVELKKYQDIVKKICIKIGKDKSKDMKDYITGAKEGMEPDGKFDKALEEVSIELKITRGKENIKKFITDYSWWHGSKTIDRKDFYVSPVLNILKLVNVSQDYVAAISEQFANDKALMDKLDIKLITEKNSIKTINNKNEFKIKELYYENIEIIEKQIQKSINAGKNIILVGPPGTGKSQLSKQICDYYKVNYKMVTATSDWSTYDTIGGYKLNDDGKLFFDEGIFLSCFKDEEHSIKNEWLIIDEMNRADIDKAFGSFFSVLAGDSVKLSFKDSFKKNIEIINEKEVASINNIKSNEYVIPNDWRMIGSINTFDKTSLFEMSYAFMRRFAFISVTVPRNITTEIIEQYLRFWNIDNLNIDNTYLAEALKKVWILINSYRVIGPAIIKDISEYVKSKEDWASAIVLYVLPQFDGIEEIQLKKFINDISDSKILGLSEDDLKIINNFLFDFMGMQL